MHHYFAYRARLNRMELRRLLSDGQKSLLIGLAFLSVCLMASRAIGGDGAATFRSIARESLTIAGWVAMWRPLEICLYDWWPIYEERRRLERLARIRVQIFAAPALTPALFVGEEYRHAETSGAAA